jgi:Amidohydrolase family
VKRRVFECIIGDKRGNRLLLVSFSILAAKQRAAALLALLSTVCVTAVSPAERTAGDGPFQRLILRGVTLIDGTGAPPAGPVDIVITGNRIANVVSVPIDPAARPKAAAGDRELELAGMYVLPGFIDLYGHVGEPLDYVMKLWLAHGVTTVREPLCLAGMKSCLELKAKSDRNEIAAPRIVPYLYFGQGRDEIPFLDPREARKWVQEAARQGAAGIDFWQGERPEILAAALDEAAKRGLRTACRHTQKYAARANALDTARWGLDILEHWYGVPEALLPDGGLQAYPPGYNDSDEQQRFAQAGRLWRQAAPPESGRWNAVIGELVGRGLAMVPTLGLYEANRDLMRASRAEWHDQYTLPALWDAFAPNRAAHAAHWFYWTTEDEVAWRDNYRLWMAFLNEYKNRGGRVAVGSDSGFMYNLYGFGYVREMELLREAGFQPLEVIRAATRVGAEVLGRQADLGTVEPGKLADLVVVAENPLENLKVLYGTGALKLDRDNRPVRVGGVRYTLKDGILYDAKQLLADVRRMVEEAKARDGRRLLPPGMAEEPAGAAPPHP